MRKIFASPWMTIVILVIISILSLFTILSVAPSLFRIQLIYFILGFGIYYLVSRIHPEYFRYFSRSFYIISFILLLITFLVGVLIKGSIRWINIPGIGQFQPSEIIKPLFIVFFADRFSKKNLNLNKIVLNIFLFSLLAGLVFKQPDLGNFIVYSAIFLFILFFSKAKKSYLTLIIFIGITAFPLVFLSLKPYQKSRLTSFLHPERDPQGTAYHQIQSVVAVGSGGLFGRGIGRGTQTHLYFLPEEHTDFIFAAYSEEFGLVGDLALLICYFYLFLKLIFLISRSKQEFEKLLLIGIFAYLYSQSIIHICMNIGLLPVTGITLPLFSAGGSSITSVLFTLGLVAFFERNLV